MIDTQAIDLEMKSVVPTRGRVQPERQCQHHRDAELQQVQADLLRQRDQIGLSRRIAAGGSMNMPAISMMPIMARMISHGACNVSIARLRTAAGPARRS